MRVTEEEELDECKSWNQPAAFEYLGIRNDLLVYHNQKTFKQEAFGDDRVLHHSVLKKLRADMLSPHWFKTFVQTAELNDEIAWLQLGQESIVEFEKIEFIDSYFKSGWAQWPTKEIPDGKYKYTSIVVLFNQNLVRINRTAYSSLDWLGDVGGLFDALYLIGKFLMGPLATFTLQAELLSQGFRFLPSLSSNKAPPLLDSS